VRSRGAFVRARSRACGRFTRETGARRGVTRAIRSKSEGLNSAREPYVASVGEALARARAYLTKMKSNVVPDEVNRRRKDGESGGESRGARARS
jgi:hypothetical protein